MELSYLDITNNLGTDYISKRYIDKALFYCCSCSYRLSETILKDLTGSDQLSRQSLNNLVRDQALKHSDSYMLEYAKYSDTNYAEINTDFDIYDSNIKETIIEIDGILSKKQKYLRDKNPRTQKEFIVNDICILQKKDGFYDYIIPPIDENGDNRLNLSECINLSIKKNYSDSTINIISISDGATDIRNTLKNCFGDNVKIILDWYHICKKTREFLSMISKNKVSKLRDLKHLLHLFWTGEINNAIDYVKVLDSKNDLQKDRFLKYLEKHKSEIINYEKRKKSGKTIGSGRIEKAVDQAVGIRQKKKAMSWSKNGSKSLAFLNIFHLNKNNKNSKSKYAEI